MIQTKKLVAVLIVVLSLLLPISSTEAQYKFLNATDFPGVTGKCSDDQTEGLTQWLAALNVGGKATPVGFLPHGCYKFTSLPEIVRNGVRIWGEGPGSVLYSANTSGRSALRITGRGVKLRDFNIEGHPLSGHGIELYEAHHARAENVFVASAGGSAWYLAGVVEFVCDSCRGFINIPGEREWTSEIGLLMEDGNLVPGALPRGKPHRNITAVGSPNHTNNNHSWINFQATGGVVSQQVMYGGAKEHRNIRFLSGTIEGTDAGPGLVFRQVRDSIIQGIHFEKNNFADVQLVDSTNVIIESGVMRSDLRLEGDTTGATIRNVTITGLVRFITTNNDVPRMTSIENSRLTSTKGDNGGPFVGKGQNTMVLHSTNNSNGTFPFNEIPGELVMLKAGEFSGELPPAGGSNNNRILIEDSGYGKQSLVFYVGGKRYRVQGVEF